MKSILIPVLCLLIFFSCKKTGTEENPPMNNDLIGTWKVKRYIAANLSNGQPNDTLISTHNETYKFTKDSVFIDAWLALFDDYTVNPPTFKIIDTIEHKGAYAYTKNGNTYTLHLSSFSETIDIVSLTSTQLTTHENLQAINSNSICRDFYVNFEK